MREILYRAISMCKGERWLYGQPRHYNHNPHTEKWTMFDPATGIETDIDDETLGEYAQIDDLESNPIFDGDILKVQSLHPDTLGQECFCKVTYERGCFWVERIDKPVLKQPLTDCELQNNIVVVGNVFDNPELLKGGNQ